jgi:hypothetical protein
MLRNGSVLEAAREYLREPACHEHKTAATIFSHTALLARETPLTAICKLSAFADCGRSCPSNAKGGDVTFSIRLSLFFQPAQKDGGSRSSEVAQAAGQPNRADNG